MNIVFAKMEIDRMRYFCLVPYDFVVVEYKLYMYAIIRMKDDLHICQPAT